MTFSRIQHGHNVTRYYINGKRVTAQQYEFMKVFCRLQGKQQSCLLTKQIAPNKYKHTFEVN